MKKKALTADQRQQRYQWKKKHRKSLNEERQQNTIDRLSRAVAQLEGQTFPSQNKALTALKEQCWKLDTIKPGYTTFRKYKHLWIHLVEGQSAATQNHHPSDRTDETAVD